MTIGIGAAVTLAVMQPLLMIACYIIGHKNGFDFWSRNSVEFINRFTITERNDEDA